MATLTFNQMEAQIKETINKNCIVVYVRPGCPFCTMAEKAFQDLKVEYRCIDICADRKNTETIKGVLEFMTRARTVPRVFVGGKFIGGGTETKKLYDTGKLKELIDACQQN